MSAMAVAVTADVSSAVDAAQPVTTAATIDFRALIASLSQYELPVAEAALVPGKLLPLPTFDGEQPEASASDAGGETQPASDLQAAIAAMSTLPWPVSTVLSTADSQNTEQLEAKSEVVGAAAAKPLPRSEPSNANAATVLPQLLRKTDLSADQHSAQQPVPATAAAPEPTALIGKAGGMGMLPDTDAALTERKQEDRPESRSNQAVAELRANFSAVMTDVPNSPRVERAVNVPVHDARWPAAVANEVRWCAQAGIQSATLKLVPENLGPIELHIDLQDNKVNVSFAANQSDTRTALEQSIPRLRELLAGSGLTLGQAHVQQEARRDSQFVAVTPRVAAGERSDAEVHTARIAIGLVDEYA